MSPNARMHQDPDGAPLDVIGLTAFAVVLLALACCAVIAMGPPRSAPVAGALLALVGAATIIAWLSRRAARARSATSR